MRWNPFAHDEHANELESILQQNGGYIDKELQLSVQELERPVSDIGAAIDSYLQTVPWCSSSWQYCS